MGEQGRLLKQVADLDEAARSKEASWELAAHLLLVSSTERLDSFTNGNFDLARCSIGGEIQLTVSVHFAVSRTP